MVRGYQADASEVGDEKSAWGNLYEERLRGRNAMKTPDEGWLIAKPLLHHGDWNSYEILADGDHIRLTFNGHVTIDMHDHASADGIIALQLHAGPEMRVEFRNLETEETPLTMRRFLITFLGAVVLNPGRPVDHVWRQPATRWLGA